MEEWQSLRVCDLVAAMGFSKREVNVRRIECEFQETVNNLSKGYKNCTGEYILSGSSSEGMTGGAFYDADHSDIDQLINIKSVKVVEQKEDINRNDTCSSIIVREVYDNGYPGYEKLELLKVDPNKESLLLSDLLAAIKKKFRFVEFVPVLRHENFFPNNYFFELLKIELRDSPSSAFFRHGPAICQSIPPSEDDLHLLSKISPFDQAKPRDVKLTMNTLTQHTDYVFCIRSLSWPCESIKFMTRQRCGNWPKKETLEYLVQCTPVFLAPVGHKDSPDQDIQWRLSFNVAEKLLIKDFNETQIQCYALLKIICNDIFKKVSPNILSSYCMKTTMFWLSEREGSDNMVPEKLLHYFVQGLKMIQTWLKSHKMPHYFIESRNMLPSNLDPVEVKSLMAAMEKAISEPYLTVKKSKSIGIIVWLSKGDLLRFPKLSDQSYLIAWVEMRIKILQTMYLFVMDRSHWIFYDTKHFSECIERFKHVVDNTKAIPYGHHLHKIFKSILGFLCFADHRGCLETTSETLSVKEIETLLLEGEDGDSTLCPLKLATFYLMEKNFAKVQMISTSVLQMRQNSHIEHNLFHYCKEIMQEQTNIVMSIEDTKTLEILVAIATADLSSKTQYDEILYCREERKNVRQLLYSPIEVSKQFSFDLMFMMPEFSALPRAVQLEIVFSEPIKCEYNYCIGVTITPVDYALFLKFLAYKATLDQAGCRETLDKFQDHLQSDSMLNKARGYNLLASCYGMMVTISCFPTTFPDNGDFVNSASELCGMGGIFRVRPGRR